MRKYFCLFLILNLLSACSDAEDNTNLQQSSVSQEDFQHTDYADKNFHFSANDMTSGCSDDSQMICAINLAIKCSINPKWNECDKTKMPNFIFMEDESLQRPTEVSYRVLKLKPIPGGQIEVYTQSSCNGQWFGLCNGNIIYVMEQKEDQWIVKDLYAMQTFN